MILLTFQRDDEKYDFIQVSPELGELLMQKNALDNLAETYKDEREQGVFMLLTKMGISPFSIKENINILHDIEYPEAQELVEMYGHELEETSTATIH